MKSVDHGYDVTLNSRYLRRLLEILAQKLSEAGFRMTELTP